MDMIVEEGTENNRPSTPCPLKPAEGAKCKIILELERMAAIPMDFEFPLNESFDFEIGENDTETGLMVDKELQSMTCNNTRDIDIKLPQNLPCQKSCEGRPSFTESGQEQNGSLETTFTTTKMRISLLDFEPGKEMWRMSSIEKFQFANHHKGRGTDLYKKGLVKPAFHRYSKAIKYLICLDKNSNIAGANELQMLCYLNIAACQLQYKNLDAVVKNCSRALDIDGNNVKGLYRRGQAYAQFKQYDLAYIDLTRGLELDKDNKAIETLLKFVKGKLKSQDDQIAKGLSKMFVCQKV